MTSSKTYRSIAGVTLLALAACAPSGSPAPSGPTVTSVDGVRIVENSGAAWTEADAWRLSAEPILTLGADVGESYEMFANIRSPRQLSDGRIVVADNSHELRYFDADGGYLFSRGGPGQGPGEFTYIGSPMRTPGDGFLINNLNARNMLTFDGAGNFLSTLVLEAHGMEHRTARVIGVFGDGSLLARATLRGEPIPAGQIEWQQLGLFRYLGDGTQPGWLGDFPSGEASGGEGQLALPARAVFATYDEGFYVTDGRAAEIQAYDLEGRLWQRIRWPAEIIEVSDATKQEYYTTSRANIEAFGGDPRAEARMAEAVFAPTVPLLARMTIDEEGNIWAMRHAGVAFPITYPNSPGGLNEPRPSTWEVFSAEGAWLGAVELPPGVYIGQIGPDYVLTAGQDESGVDHVWKYALIKP